MSADPDLPRRWTDARPRCRKCFRTLGACACAAIYFAVTVAQHDPDHRHEQTGPAGAKLITALTTNTATSTSTTWSTGYSFDFDYHEFNDETAGGEIGSQPIWVGRAATARRHMIQVDRKLGEPVSVVFSQEPPLKRDT